LKTGYLGAKGSFAPYTYVDSMESLIQDALPVQHSSYDGGARYKKIKDLNQNLVIIFVNV